MTFAKQKYARSKRELLTIVGTLKNWKVYCYGRNFTVLTNYFPVRYLQTQKHLYQIEICWFELIASFYFKTVSTKRKTNVLAVALSQKDYQKPVRSQNERFLLTRSVAFTSHKLIQVSRLCLRRRNSWEIISKLYKNNGFWDKLNHSKKLFKIFNGFLYYNNRLCVSSSKIRKIIINETHKPPQSGKMGAKKTLVRKVWKYYEKYEKTQDYVTSSNNFLLQSNSPIISRLDCWNL